MSDFDSTIRRLSKHVGKQTAAYTDSAAVSAVNEASNIASAAAGAVAADLATHIADTANPHATTAGQVGAEPALGNPGVNGYVLSSTTGGVRSWVAQSGGGGGMANPMTTQDDIIIGGASGTPARLAKGADGQVLTVDPATHHLVWKDPASGSGTVTSVGLSAPAQYSVSGSPVTSSGTLALAWLAQVANRILAGPASGADAAPTFRALVAADLPNAAADAIGALRIDQSGPAAYAIALTLGAAMLAGGAVTLGGDGLVPSIALPGQIGTLVEADRWQRQGTILDPTDAWEDTAVQEPSIIYEDGTWKMWYTGGWSGTEAIGYATCTGDPTVAGNWTKHGKVLGGGGSGYAGDARHHGVFRIHGQYYAYFADSNYSSLYVSTSADGITWGTPAVAIASNQVAWSTSWVNPYVWTEGSAWHMMLEGFGVNWFVARATSTDGLAWTIQGSGPLTSLEVASGGGYSGPWMAGKRHGLYQLWYHAAPVSGSLPTNIYRATSSDGVTWTKLGVVLTHLGVDPEYDQVADAAVVEADGTTYLFYDALNNITGASVIRVATIDATLGEVIDGSTPGAAAATGELLVDDDGYLLQQDDGDVLYEY